MFGRQRAGEALIGEIATEQASRFLRSHPRLRVIDVSNAGGAVSGSGYLRESPWVSSDVVLSLRYDLAPEERGLTRAPGSPIWTFPDDYLERAGGGAGSSRVGGPLTRRSMPAGETTCAYAFSAGPDSLRASRGASQSGWQHSPTDQLDASGPHRLRTWRTVI